jgi:lon-related putative ATP-dependent protease
MAKPQELPPEALHNPCDPNDFDFETTDELPNLEKVLGQPRAFRALEMGSEVTGPGFNIFVAGLPDSGRTTLTSEYLKRKAINEPTPDDWCYVNNFDNPHNPKAINLPAGMGPALRHDSQNLIDRCKQEIRQAFASDEYNRERNKLSQAMQAEQEEEFKKLEAKARENNFSIARTSSGLAIVPTVDGEPLKPEEIEQLSEQHQEKLKKLQSRLQHTTQETIRKIQAIGEAYYQRFQELDKHTALFAIEHLFDQVKGKYEQFDKVIEHLEAVQEDIVENVDNFRGDPEKAAQIEQWMARYSVNVLVNNCDLDGAPVVMESHPTYNNLAGRIEHRLVMGATQTNFTMIRPGSLHRANGGYLLLPARDVLLNPYAWEGLERALRDGEIRIRTLGAEMNIINTVSLEPEAIPLSVKVILFGTPLLYELLRENDVDFSKLFKIRAEFATIMDRTKENAYEYALFVKSVVDNNELPAFDKTAVARIIEYSSRLAEDQHKFSTRFGRIADLVREAAYWAQRDNRNPVTAGDVNRAIAEKEFRDNLHEERTHELIEQATLFIDVSGKAVGQVNALSVMEYGEYYFGRPNRVTASVYPGNDGVIDIERQADLGGPIHTKGVMIISGLLGRRYGHQKPLSLTANLTFEQSYNGVEGDSASAAELCALLSSIANVPLRQDRAMTGSINQIGEIQPIGGVNEKIEGFFTACKNKGLTGEQGVIIPQANVRHLMLKAEVIEAVEGGNFHIWPITKLDQALALFTDMEIGELQQDGSYPEGSFNAAVAERLTEFHDVLKGKDDNEGEREEQSAEQE